MRSRNRTLALLAILFVFVAGLTAFSRIRPKEASQATVAAATAQAPVTRVNNPNYPIPNPFYFEGKIQYELTGIDTPQNAWEYAQRGMYKQDDLEDFDGAIADYKTSVSMNSLQNGTCQIVTTAPVPSTLNPPPCMFTVRSRLAYLLMDSDPATAISLFQEVLQIDPLRLEINALIGETYAKEGDNATDIAMKQQFYQKAVDAYNAELNLSPVTPQAVQMTGDEANNSDVHWELADVYEKLGQNANAKSELGLYLKATKWHSDTYPWRIALANMKIQELGQ